jgi:hypothetical protein
MFRQILDLLTEIRDLLKELLAVLRARKSAATLTDARGHAEHIQKLEECVRHRDAQIKRLTELMAKTAQKDAKRKGGQS